MAKKLMLLVLHCTATPMGRELSGADVRRMHTAPVSEGGRGWMQVGYSDLIHLGGMVENLVPYNGDGLVQPREITNGAVGHNDVSRHVAYVGGMDADMKYAVDTRTPLQKQAMANYVRQTIAQHPDIRVAGHNQLAAKACPSFDTVAWLRGIGIAEKNIFKN